MVRALRLRRGWRQIDLAAAAGVSRSVVARLEQGRGDRLPVATLVGVTAPLGARVRLTLDWHGEALARLTDGPHAMLVDQVVRLLTALGWQCRTEVTFSIRGERGSIDVLAYHAETGAILVVEVKSVVPDVGGMLMTLDRKARLAPEIARDLGWAVARAPASRSLVVREAMTARRRVEAADAVFGVELPVRGRAIRAWLRAPEPARPLAGLWFLSPDRHEVVRRPRRVRRRAPGPEPHVPVLR